MQRHCSAILAQYRCDQVARLSEEQADARQEGGRRRPIAKVDGFGGRPTPLSVRFGVAGRYAAEGKSENCGGEASRQESLILAADNHQF